MTDREIVEFLDESVCWHEWSDFYVVTVHGYPCKHCDVVAGRIHIYDPLPENQEPTLEWMLSALRKKGLLIKFAPFGTCNKDIQVWCIIRKPDSDMRDIVSDWVATETLALRGAVCKLMESEVNK